ncbi:MAG: glycosyltransferase family 1 protein [Planctomycetes bacterium]|nr:glycosyltransferase family 1 protein [Planctomycetota bacterium]
MDPPTRTTASMRVALVTETWRPEINGVAMTLGRLVDGLRQRHHCVTVVRPRQDGDVGADAHGDITLPSLPVPRYVGMRFGLPARLGLLVRWRRTPPDLVHIATEGPLGLSALSAARELGIAVTSGFHTNFHDYTRHYGLGLLYGSVARYLRWFHNRTRATLVPTAVQARDLGRLGFRNVHTLSRGVDAELYRPSKRSQRLRDSWGIGPDALVCLLVGRVAAEKNIPLALQAFRAIRAVRPDVVMVVVGDGPERARLAAGNPDIRFTGALDPESLAEHYASGDLFLYPSLSETYGNVALEAMASGLAVVAFDYAAPAMHIEHRVSGMLAPFDDADEFIRMSVEAACDLAWIRRMGAQACVRASGQSWSSIIDQFEAILTSARERVCS